MSKITDNLKAAIEQAFSEADESRAIDLTHIPKIMAATANAIYDLDARLDAIEERLNTLN